jgi:MFS family permease
MLLANLLVFVSGVASIISKPFHTYITLLIGRSVAGLVTGLFSGIAPMYLTEIPPKNYRGISGVFNQLSIVIGLLVANIFGLPQLFGTEKLWPYLVGINIVPAVLLYFAAPFIVESPKYVYINKNNPRGAQDSKKILFFQEYKHLF